VIRCPTIYGFDLVLDEQTGGNVYRFGFYEAGTLDVMQRVLRPGDVFVDAGASIGLMSLFASQCVRDGGRVLSFEPLPRRYSQLVESIGLNGRRNISAFPFGLGASAQDLSIFTDRVSPSMVPQAGSTRSENARVEALSDVLEREQVKSLRMIKIDVEGFELDVLQGCKSWLTGKEPPVVCVEYGVYDGASARLLAFLRALPGYRLYQLSGKKKYASKLDLVAPGQQFRSGDNIFCFPPGISI
jgi:FkbM family methyltransferase